MCHWRAAVWTVPEGRVWSLAPPPGSVPQVPSSVAHDVVDVTLNTARDKGQREPADTSQLWSPKVPS